MVSTHAGEIRSEDTILKDVKRTTFCYSQSQELIKLLKRVALNFPKTGYYQGMNCIGGFLLKYSGNYKKSLTVFNYLMEKRLAKYFSEKFKNAKQLFYVCERLFELYLPNFYKHLKEMNIKAEEYLLQTQLTLYTASLQVSHILKLIHEETLAFQQIEIYQRRINIVLDEFKQDIALFTIPKNLMMAIEYQYVDTAATVQEFWHNYYEMRRAKK